MPVNKAGCPQHWENGEYGNKYCPRGICKNVQNRGHDLLTVNLLAKVGKAQGLSGVLGVLSIELDWAFIYLPGIYLSI